MSNIEIMLISLGLSMDAFSVAICKGISINNIKRRTCIKIGAYFGLFQAVMPLLGYTLGTNFKYVIVAFDHWITFILLLLIGINMIKGAYDKEEELTNETSPKIMIPLALATSIDALAVGVTFAFLKVKLLKSILIIGSVTFILTTLGTNLGNKFGTKYKNKSQILGGIILIIIGLKILIEHLR